MRFPMTRGRPAAPDTRPGLGKKFAFNVTGETSFTNFTSDEIIKILKAMRTDDSMTAEFEERDQ